jgi:glycosyltransferase involved in cell wall biosynthesis
MQISRIISGFDVVHVHVFPASYIVAMATFFSRKKNHIVFTEHNSFNRRASHWGFKYIEKLVYSRFKKVVCLSEQVNQFVKKYLNVPEVKLCIIQNAIDYQSVKNAEAYTKGDLGFSKKDFILLMSARLSPQKNHGQLLKAMTLLSDDIKLLLAGDGELRNVLQFEIFKLGLADRVFFLGSRNDVFSVMKAVDVNILVSNFEGLSLAALEAMSSGKPFIASDVEGLDFVVKDSRLLFKNNPNDISKAINKLRDEPEWFIEASELCKSRASEFDIRYMVEEYLEVYRNVL